MNAETDIQITPIGPDEVHAVAALARQIWQVAYLDLIGQAQIDYMLAQRYAAQRLTDELARPDIWWRQIFVEGERCGFSCCQLTEEAATLKLDKLYVHPAQQRQGLGARLVADACQLALAQGCRRLILAVNKGNQAAIAAYRRYGFTVEKSVRVDIGGGFVMDDFVMAKSLA